MQSQKVRQLLCVGVAQAGSFGCVAQAVGIFLLQHGDEGGTVGLCHPHAVQPCGDKAHVAQFQHIAVGKGVEAVHRQADHLGLLSAADRTQAFQPHLADLGKDVAFPAGTADLLGIEILLAAAGRRLGIFGNGQRHVGADGPQFAVQIGESDHLGVGQEAFVLLIERILLKPGHAVFAVAGFLVEQAQLQGAALGRRKGGYVEIHVSSPLVLPLTGIFYKVSPVLRVPGPVWIKIKKQTRFARWYKAAPAMMPIYPRQPRSSQSAKSSGAAIFVTSTLPSTTGGAGLWCSTGFRLGPPSWGRTGR